MTFEVDGAKIEVHYFICHDAEAILSFQVSLEPIMLEYHTHIERQDFLDGCLTLVTVMHATTLGVQVSLTWT